MRPRLRMTPLLACVLLIATPRGADAATTGKSKIGGNGPVDRPTVHTTAWCYSNWTLCGADPDTFIADGDSATVVVRARNWKAVDPDDPIDFHIDNVVVVERSIYDAYYLDINDDPEAEAFNCDYPFTGTFALDFAAIPSNQLVYLSLFDGSIGPEWSYDATQVSYETTGTNVQTALYDDPFDPSLSTTGNMRIGNGSGPEFVEATLQLSGLTPGTEYVFSYWSGSFFASEGFGCSPGEVYDDYEISIFGETDVCLPDLPTLGVHDVRTLEWNPTTGIWRFQLQFESNGAGEAFDATATIIDTPTGVEVLEDKVPIPYFGTDVRTMTPWAGGSFVVDLSQHQLPFLVLTLRYEFTDDCDGESQQDRTSILSEPGVYPTAVPAATAQLALGPTVPNPFNPSTILPLSMPVDGHAKLVLYDVSGRLVRTLHDGPLPAGTHDMRWDGRDQSGRTVSSGVYLAQVRSGSQIASRRLLLLK